MPDTGATNTSRLRGRLVYWCIAAAWLALAVVLLFVGRSKLDPGSARAATATCQKYVRARLLDPAAAKFEDHEEEQTSSNHWRVTGHVSGPDRNGIVKGARYECTMEYLGKGKWETTNI